MPNRTYAEGGLKMGLGGNPEKPSSPKAGSTPGMPEKTAAWPGVPGGTQRGSRSGGTPTTGHCGPFYVKKVGL